MGVGLWNAGSVSHLQFRVRDRAERDGTWRHCQDDCGRGFLRPNATSMPTDGHSTRPSTHTVRRSCSVDLRLTSFNSQTHSTLAGDATAIERFRVVIELAPEHAEAWNNLGGVLQRRAKRTNSLKLESTCH